MHEGEGNGGLEDESVEQLGLEGLEVGRARRPGDDCAHFAVTLDTETDHSDDW